MLALLTPEGQLALEETMRRKPLLAFDFDGTLAPIVARPDDATVPADVSSLLRQLAARLPTAVVTGRSVADVTPRLGFVPRYVVGNHGAEDVGQALPPDALTALDDLRARVEARRAALAQAGVHIEDKRQSLALHYRLASSQLDATLAIQALLHDLPPALTQFGGKCVVNVTAASAPDKGDAVWSLLRRSGASCAVFAGDDVNDESVFLRAPADWLTVRIGRDDPLSRARYVLDDHADVAAMLRRMLAALMS